MAFLNINDGQLIFDMNAYARLIAKRCSDKKVSFKEAIEKVEKRKVEIIPDDFAGCIVFGNTNGNNKPNLSLDKLQTAMNYAIRDRFDAMLAYGEVGIEKWYLEHKQQGEDPAFTLPDQDLSLPGESLMLKISTPEGKAVFPSGEIPTILSGDNKKIYVHGFNPENPGGTRIEATHLQSFDQRTQVVFPAHIATRDGTYRGAVFKCNVQLPEKPKKIAEFNVEIVDYKPTILYIGDMGLYVPLDDETFCIKVSKNDPMYDGNDTLPRFIDGIKIMRVDKLGEVLEITPILNQENDEKVIYTHVFSKGSNESVPIKINLRFSSSSEEL